MAKSARKPKAKQVQRLKKENTEHVKDSRVTKPPKTSPTRNRPLTPSKHGMRTRAKSTAKSEEQQPPSTPPNNNPPSEIDDAYYTSLSQELKKTPKTPKTRRTGRTKHVVEAPVTPRNQSPIDEYRTNITFVWDLFSTDRSFWDSIRETSS
ncbi:MAG: hypothetical protein Q9192_005583, partial [Flavoplaca navasiana]